MAPRSLDGKAIDSDNEDEFDSAPGTSGYNNSGGSARKYADEDEDEDDGFSYENMFQQHFRNQSAGRRCSREEEEAYRYFFEQMHRQAHKWDQRARRKQMKKSEEQLKAEKEHRIALERQREHERRRSEQKAREESEARARAHQEGREWCASF